MDESSMRMRANMEKVLRAMDVIPPFRHGDEGDVLGGRSPRHVPSQPHGGQYYCAAGQTSSAAGPNETGYEAPNEAAIPEFDLGERILAEQRRMTAKKRKAPGEGSNIKGGSHVREAGTTARMPLAAPSPDDLLQLQQIVADIVRRDIARLCVGSTKAAY
jgi:hypothetical protein